jgi:hypothetical protein
MSDETVIIIPSGVFHFRVYYEREYNEDYNENEEEGNEEEGNEENEEEGNEGNEGNENSPIGAIDNPLFIEIASDGNEMKSGPNVIEAIDHFLEVMSSHIYDYMHLVYYHLGGPIINIDYIPPPGAPPGASVRCQK